MAKRGGIRVDIQHESDWIMYVNDGVGPYMWFDVCIKRLRWDWSEINRMGAKTMNNQRSMAEQSVLGLIWEGYGLGTKGNEVEVKLKQYKVSQRWGEHSMMLFCIKWECYVNISKNNLGEVEMVLEGSDTTNSP